MIKKIWILLLTVVTGLSVVAQLGIEWDNGLYSEDDLTDFIDSIDSTIIDKYDFDSEDLQKLGIDINDNFDPLVLDDYIVILNEDPLNIQLSKGTSLSSGEIELNIKTAVDNFYDEMNISATSLTGYLGLSEEDYGSNEITVTHTYEYSMVGASMTMPAEYLFYLISIDEVYMVVDNSAIEASTVDYDDTYIPEDVSEEGVFANIHQSIDYLGVNNIHNGAWTEGIELQGSGVHVAIMDTGIDWTHEDLTEAMFGYNESVDTSGGWEDRDASWLQGWGHYDFVQDDFDPMEATPEDYQIELEAYQETGINPPASFQLEYYTTGHGTHVAGTVASQGNVENASNVEGRTYVGMAPDVNLIGIRVLGAGGAGTVTNFLQGVEHIASFTYQDLIDDTQATDNPFDWDAYVLSEVARGRDASTLSKDNLVIDVVNMSLGGGSSTPNTAFNLAVGNLTDLGVVVVAAAGNNGAWGLYTTHAPGASDKVITVGAAPADYYIEQVDMNYANTNFTLNAFAYPTTDDYNSLVTEALENKSFIFADTGTTSDFIGVNAENKIVVLDRGDISFWFKYLNSVNKGAEAVIVVNYQAYTNKPIYEYYGEYNVFSIPMFNIDSNQGQVLKDLVEKNQSSTATVTNINSDQTNGKIRLANQAVAGFSSSGPSLGSFAIKPDIIAPGVHIMSTVPAFYNRSISQPERTPETSYADMQGTSMASPHVAGIAALMVENYRYVEKVWDDESIMPLGDRAQMLKVAIMNTANHDIFSLGEYDTETYEVTDYSVFKRSVGLINPQRAIAYSLDTSIYVDYSLEYTYVDAEKSGSADDVSTLTIDNIRTGLINYGVVIGNSTNNAADFDYDWVDRAVTIDNTLVDTDKYYYVEFVGNLSQYSENYSTMKFTVSSITGSETSTSTTIGDIDQSNFNNGSVQDYFISGNNGMYIHVPANEKVDVVIELASLGINAENGIYEGYFEFNEMVVDPAGTTRLYNPYTYDYADVTNSPSMTFSHATYSVGSYTSSIGGYDNIVSSLPFAINYAKPGADFTFRYPFTTTKSTGHLSAMSVTLYTDLIREARIYVKKAVLDEDGEIVKDSEGNTVTEYVGVIPSINIPEGYYKGISVQTAAFLTRTYYTGDESLITPGANYDSQLIFDTEHVPEGLNLELAEQGLYEFEVYYEYMDNASGEEVAVKQDDIWFYVHDEGPELGFGEVGSRLDPTLETNDAYVYTEPGIYHVTEDDFDANGYIWIKGWVYDEAIELMYNYEPEALQHYKINQSKTTVAAYINSNPFAAFSATVEDDGSFNIGIHKDDVLGAGIELQLQPISFLSNMNVPYFPNFVFVDQNYEYYTYTRTELYPTLDTVQGLEITGNNFDQYIKGSFGLDLGATRGITSIEATEELQAIIDQYDLTLNLSYRDVSTGSTTIYWELEGENFLGLSGTMPLFDITLTPVSDSSVNSISKLGVRSAYMSSYYVYTHEDILGEETYLRIYDATPKGDDFLPLGMYVEYDKSLVTVNLGSIFTSEIYKNGFNPFESGLRMTVYGPNGKVYEGLLTTYDYVKVPIPTLDGDYIFEMEAPGYLPIKIVLPIEHDEQREDGSNIAQQFGYNYGSVTGVAGDINNDGIIDVRDAYYLLLLDASSNAANLTAAQMTEFNQFRYIFGSITENFGAVSYQLEEAPEILTTYGGLTMYDIAVKLGYAKYYQEVQFPEFDLLTIDPEATITTEDRGDIYLTSPHAFLEQEEVFKMLDEVYGNHDGVLSSVEVGRITSLTMNEYFYSYLNRFTSLGYMDNLKEVNIIDNDITGIGRNLQNAYDLEKIQIVNGGVEEIDTYYMTSAKENLRTLILSGNEINDISATFIHTDATNIETLDISNNKLLDLDGIQKTTSLRYLYASNNDITSIEGIEELVNLEVLDLRGNQITDLSPLQYLTNLRILLLDENQISDLSPLENLNLQILSVKDNEINDIKPITHMDLEVLNLANNQLTSTDDFSAFTSIKNLYLQSNQIEDLSGLANLSELVELNVNYNYINFANGTTSSIVINKIRNNSNGGVMLNVYTQYPIIDLINDDVYVIEGTEYKDAAGEIIWLGGKLSLTSWKLLVEVEGLNSVDTNTIGTYIITYKITIAGLESRIVTRTVHVISADSLDGQGEIISSK